MGLPTLDQADFWKTKSAQVIVYTNTKQLKQFVNGQTLEKLVSHLAKKNQLSESNDPIKEGLLADSKTVQHVYCLYCDETGRDIYRNIAANLARKARKSQQHDLAITLAIPSLDESMTTIIIQQLYEGFYLGDYQYQGYQTMVPKKEKHNTKLSFYGIKNKEITSAIKKGTILAKAQNMARDLANTPANYLTPKEFVSIAKKQCRNSALSIKVYDKKAAQKKKMGSFLAVAQGSVQAPYMLELTLNASKKSPIILVGKGVTFDTGGISLKPSRSMSCMKGDMGGAAAVYAAMVALAQLKTKHHVKAIIPLVENMPSAMAYKPGDVITAMNKKTIEVINTDAEGRLILADALCLATTYKPKLIIDIATLTGACAVTLGDVANAVLGNSQTAINAFLNRQDEVGERLWQLPLYDDYVDYLKSSVADMTNCAENRLAGTSTAAMFLKQFVDTSTWVHIDIASTMENKTTKGYHVKGMNGSGTRTLIEAILATP
ncbi:hypothetical protein CL658_02730 [bacterium]|nr:hypothetical protein [bacterium]|tara:strand:- start:43 stop:1512 length:1470 start_codon:yes stop_codon:yes gene_type:complete